MKGYSVQKFVPRTTNQWFTGNQDTLCQSSIPRFLELLNQIRAKHSKTSGTWLMPLRLSTRLSHAARSKIVAMQKAGNWGWDDRKQPSWLEITRAAGNPDLLEGVLLSVNTSPEAAVNNLVTCTHQNCTINGLNPDYREIGIAVVSRSASRVWWVIMFSK